MNSSFSRLMAEATRLTRSGSLRAATDVIRQALAGSASAAKHPRPEAVAAHAASDVIDVPAREVPDHTADNAPAAPAAPATGQFITGSHTDANGTRAYKLYLPPGASGQPLPLVVMLHGCTQDPDDFAAGTGMNDAALERGFCVLYPAQNQHANAHRCWNWFKHNHQARGRGEPALLAGMTHAVMAEHAIDPQRVYVAGLSAGGAMAAILGDAYPDLFAAVGVHSGLATGAATDLPSAFAAMQAGASGSTAAHAPPTIVFHGDADSTVHPTNGQHVIAASARNAVAQAERARSENGRDYTRQTFRDSSGRVLAEHWAVHGAGHAWSGGSARGSFTDAQGPDASAEMLRFFFANTLRKPG
jgi:poly(hydroxyalkanoate) depolymerase family esterase